MLWTKVASALEGLILSSATLCGSRAVVDIHFFPIQLLIKKKFKFSNRFLSKNLKFLFKILSRVG